MGRKRRVHKRFLIGLDLVQARTLENMARVLGLTYSEVVSYLMDYYQLGERG